MYSTIFWIFFFFPLFFFFSLSPFLICMVQSPVAVDQRSVVASRTHRSTDPLARLASVTATGLQELSLTRGLIKRKQALQVGLELRPSGQGPLFRTKSMQSLLCARAVVGIDRVNGGELTPILALLSSVQSPLIIAFLRSSPPSTRAQIPAPSSHPSSHVKRGENPLEIRAAQLTIRAHAFFSPRPGSFIHHQSGGRRNAAASLRNRSGSFFLFAMAAASRNASVLALFDVDGTLTAPRKVPRSCPPDLFLCFLFQALTTSSSLRQGVTPEMLEFMKQLRQVRIAIPLLLLLLSLFLLRWRIRVSF